MIRKAKIKDAKSIHELLARIGKQTFLLPRSLSEIYDHIRDFYVAEHSEAEGRILGTASLSVCWEDLGEIRSLAVADDFRKHALGSKLVKTCLSEAREIGLRRVFVLTLAKDFFAQFGFKEVEKSMLPHKVWADCVRCPKFPDCDEISMLLQL